MNLAQEEKSNVTLPVSLSSALLKEPEEKSFENNYELRAIIGQGGYADIWVAKDLHDHRTVAVKLLRGEKVRDPQARSAFLLEGNVMMYLQHPGVVPVYDFFKDTRGCLYVVMKLVLGRTLNDLLRQVHAEYKGLKRRDMLALERQQLRDRLKKFLKVCDIVAYAHEKRILHRDLKPANVMLGVQDDVYVMDWGIAEPHEGNAPIQTPEEPVGTVRYLAPEIICRKTYDERSDIYSLGTILFELTYLHAAFALDDDKEVCHRAVRGRTSPHVHAYKYPVPFWLKEVIYRAMSPNPEKRTRSVSEMATEIHNRLMKGPDLIERFRLFIGK